MQKLTFTQLFRQRSFMATLAPLFALVFGLGVSQKAYAQRYTSTNVTISASPTGGTPSSQVYIGRPATNGPTTPRFDGSDLGGGVLFDQTTGRLNITAASTVSNNGGVTVTSSTLFYRVFLTSASTLPSFVSPPQQLALSGSNDPNTTATVNHSSTFSIDLLNQPAVLGGGNYTVEIYFRAEYNDFGNPGSYNDPASITSNPPVGYRATFNVKAPAVTPANGTSTWISTNSSAVGTDWTNPANWSNGVPNRFADAVIPGKDVSPTGVAPVLNNPNINYEVRTLSLLNASANNKATMTITTATLRVYGDLNQPGGGLTALTILNPGFPDPTQNSTIVFAGDNQVIRGSLSVQDVRIEGTGVKSVVNRMTVFNTLIMNPTSVTNGVLLQTAVETSSGGSNPTIAVTFDTSTNIVIDLNGSGTLLGPGGIAQAETNTTFVQGVMRANRVLRAGVLETFGNIGLDITTNKPTQADVIITRIVGVALNGPTTTSATAVKRHFIVGGEVNSTANTPAADIITSNIVFHYLDSSTGYNELNGNNNEANLILFRTVNNGVPFIPQQGSAVNTTANTVTRNQLTTLNTLTLGDRTNPLPVTLASFDAKRAGADALITWQTASEQNSKGFNVQVSTDGKEFRTLGFVASYATNSSSAKNYSFSDTEKNKVGLRYYRLQQIDLDGTSAYFAPVIVSFEGKIATASNLLAYPNPFISEVNLSLTSATEGKAAISITDLNGRVVSQRQISLVNGNNDVPMTNVSNLKSGVYLMHVTMPNGESQNLKVVKQ